MIKLIVNGTSYNFPESGEDPNWSTGVTDWASAVTEALSTLIGPGDILSTSFAISNNATVPTIINGLLFDSGTVRAATVNYSVYRTSTTTPAGNAETGHIFIIFDDSAAVNEKWKLTQTTDGSAGISFSISDTGQFSYITTDIGSAGYTGVIKFTAKSLLK